MFDTPVLVANMCEAGREYEILSVELKKARSGRRCPVQSDIINNNCPSRYRMKEQIDSLYRE
jgi:hypothetical protein